METWHKVAASFLAAQQLNTERKVLSHMLLRLEDHAATVGRRRLRWRLRGAYVTLQAASFAELRRTLPVVRLLCARASRRLVLQ